MLLPEPFPSPLSMLSIRHRFLYVHIPKTGGNSVQDALRHHADDQIAIVAPHHDGVERFEVRSPHYPTVKHSTLAEYERAYGAGQLASLYRFCCVRNPWERCMSHYFSPHRGLVQWNKAAFMAFVEQEVQPLAHYLSLGPGRQPLDQALRNLHRVMRFETLAQDFAAACSEVGLPPLPLAHRNASRVSRHGQHHDVDTQACVARHLAEEIDVLGYRPPGD